MNLAKDHQAQRLMGSTRRDTVCLIAASTELVARRLKGERNRHRPERSLSGHFLRIRIRDGIASERVVLGALAVALEPDRPHHSEDGCTALELS
jgi:hypothetical protein